MNYKKKVVKEAERIVRLVDKELSRNAVLRSFASHDWQYRSKSIQTKP